MRYTPFPSKLFIENRKRFVAALPPGACAILHSNDIPRTNADGTGKFIQNANLFWLTGIDQEETVLLLFPDSPVAERKEVLFVKQTHEHIAIWEGNKLSKDQAGSLSGIQTIHWTTSFENLLTRVMSACDFVFLSTDHHPGRPVEIRDPNHRFASWCREHYPLHQYQNASPILHDLRMIKSGTEIEAMRKAAWITRDAFIASADSVRPGAYEYEVEADLSREILRKGARGFAYEPIIAAGAASCVLHYIENSRQMQTGDVLLMDVGASYANYAADMTRTVPVGGKFSARQKAVYRSVLSLFRQATQLMKPGMPLDEYHLAVQDMADKELVELGLISMTDLKTQDPKRPARSPYFLHKTAHFLGLDVHDAGNPHAVMTAGMVLTCEPGIYIREEEIGIRLENDIVITASGNEDLLSDVPLEIDEIEALFSRSNVA